MKDRAGIQIIKHFCIVNGKKNKNSGIFKLVNIIMVMNIFDMLVDIASYGK